MYPVGMLFWEIVRKKSKRMVLNFQLLGNKSVRITRQRYKATTRIGQNHLSLYRTNSYICQTITHICIANDKEKTYLLKYTHGRSVTSRICAGESRTIPGSCPKLPITSEKQRLS